MTTFFTRRALLGVGATGILAALTACASDIRPLSQGSGGSSSSASNAASGAASSSASASASPSPTDGHTPGSYVGPIKFNNYERNGTYIPATANAPASALVVHGPVDAQGDQRAQRAREQVGAQPRQSEIGA